MTNGLRFLPVLCLTTLSLAQVPMAQARAVELPSPDPLVQREVQSVMSALGEPDQAQALEVLRARRREDAAGLTAQLFLYSSAVITTSLAWEPLYSPSIPEAAIISIILEARA